MSTLETWMADIGKAADELGYGILSIDARRIVLVGRQDHVEVSIEGNLSGALLRERLVPIPHRSGHSYTTAFETEAMR